ncbi:MAG TPA: peptidoglycan DD-metalloendopeptidase family protein [Usitatibacter sp.]|nr:peptidoglycan DD-metalloendopeptidase family protein [Usitatibacter sp.]
MRAPAAVLAVALLLAGCAAHEAAPVVERPPTPTGAPGAAPAAPAPAPSAAAQPAVRTHTVMRGETLVSIALQYGLDYRELAAWNGIKDPARLSVGQVLVLAAPPGVAVPPTPPATVTTPLASVGPPIEARPLANTATLKVEPRGFKVPYSDKAMEDFSVPEPPPPPGAVAAGASPAPVPGPTGATPAPVPGPGGALPAPGPSAAAVPPSPGPAPEKGTAKEDVDWMWPVKGKVIAPFTDAAKGVDIAGKRGTPVVAAASGRVIYADAGLRGYGKLVIIRHNDTWLSAYAHNDAVLVKEQQEVRKGQKIAEMGSTDADRVMLHFEIRRHGKPVDPEKILPPM